jgi:hypothetical protein
MSQSWHNFFLGALEPGASVSIDKPPVDLWLQVASVKLVGFSATGLLLPEALFGTAAVPLLFAAVRRIWSTPAGLAAALALALLPIEVITSRSDTMDAVSGPDGAGAAVRRAGAEHGSTAWLLGAGAALGVAFDVKLSESLVALPGLVLFAAPRCRAPRRRRARVARCRRRCMSRWRSAWLLATLPSRPASGRSRSAPPTEAPGTRRSCSTGRPPRGQADARPEHLDADPPGRRAVPLCGCARARRSRCARPRRAAARPRRAARGQRLGLLVAARCCSDRRRWPASCASS